MKIHKLQYYDREYDWKLETLELLPRLNLLVGISGAGKTKILQVINSLKAIANGSSFNGIEWEVCFSIDDETKYHWSGKFQQIVKTPIFDTDSEEEDKIKIISETLKYADKFIIKRSYSEIYFNNQKTPKLSPFQSVIELLDQEDVISPIKEALDKITLTKLDFDLEKIWRLPLSILNKYENKSFLYLKESDDLPIPGKLTMVYRIFPEHFQKIKNTFIEIFPQVLDVKLDNITDITDTNIPSAFSQFLKEANTISIKEKGVNRWITNISSGMFKTLMYISYLYLSPNYSVILIDEFENSLGINCIDSVTDLILNHSNSQFIVTSHHPYIINNISPSNWKIVTRKGSVVTVKNAKDYHIPDSRQKAFIDLINVLEDEEEDDEI